jgi:hypothetical protein
MAEDAGMTTARARAREVRDLYEALEHRLLGRTWTTPELALGFTHDAAYVGRLVLAAERTSDIAGDTDAELRHKLAECLWRVFVLVDRLDVDLPEAYEGTMGRIGADLSNAVEGGYPGDGSASSPSGGDRHCGLRRRGRHGRHRPPRASQRPRPAHPTRPRHRAARPGRRRRRACGCAAGRAFCVGRA